MKLGRWDITEGEAGKSFTSRNSKERKEEGRGKKGRVRGKVRRKGKNIDLKKGKGKKGNVAWGG